MVTLTAGGRSAAPRQAPIGATVQAWDALVTRLLEAAVEYGRLDALLAKRRAWCADNWHAPRIGEREQETHFTLLARNTAAGRAMDLAEELSRLHRQLPPGVRDGLEALIGHELWEYVPQRWVMAAKASQSTDLYGIVFRATAIPAEGEGAA